MQTLADNPCYDEIYLKRERRIAKEKKCCEVVSCEERNGRKHSRLFCFLLTSSFLLPPVSGENNRNPVFVVP